jgi:hypothetical protein
VSSSSCFFLQGNALKQIHAILKETLREHAPSYATIKNWLAQFKCGDFSTCDAPLTHNSIQVRIKPKE